MTSCHGNRHLRASWDLFPSVCNTDCTQRRWHSTGTEVVVEVAENCGEGTIIVIYPPTVPLMHFILLLHMWAEALTLGTHCDKSSVSMHTVLFIQAAQEEITTYNKCVPYGLPRLIMDTFLIGYRLKHIWVSVLEGRTVWTRSPVSPCLWLCFCLTLILPTEVPPDLGLFVISHRCIITFLWLCQSLFSV